jgi:RNA polymerase sigma-70 factor (ECF subfamily)
MSADGADVVERAQRGDRNAFSELVRKYQRRVYATAYQILGNHSDADDVAQDTFVRAYRGLRTFGGRADFFTWLYRITVNTALNHLRTRKRAAALWKDVREATDDSPSPGYELDPGRLAELGDRMRRTFAAISELSDTLRITLVLATVQGMPYREIAELLSIPEGTVAWRVNEARKQVKEKLGYE